MKPADLTRWNRAGLRRFRYVDGNAVTFLELLRAELADRFPHWQEVTALPLAETEGERQERMLEQYRALRRDWAWEIARVLARSSHVLTEHLDAYANEGFLGTATQWDTVRRLVERLASVRPLALVFWGSSWLGARLSPLHGRFSMSIRAEAMLEAASLEKERVSLV